jgi:3-methylcrotonyl-CoA carboxylase beta subunit
VPERREQFDKLAFALSETPSCSSSCYTGVADHLAQDEPHALQIARDIIGNLNLPPPAYLKSTGKSGGNAGWEEPLYDPKELQGAVPTDTREPWDVRGVIARLLDGSRFEEFKSNYGKTLVTGSCLDWACGVWQHS